MIQKPLPLNYLTLFIIEVDSGSVASLFISLVIQSDGEGGEECIEWIDAQKCKANCASPSCNSGPETPRAYHHPLSLTAPNRQSVKA